MTPTTVAEKRGAPWWHIASLACVLSAVLLPFAVRALVGPPGARVHVRWQPSIDADTRRTLETRFRLSDGTPLGDTTWGYDLLDPSTDNIRALVTHPEVADTHDIERSQYAIGSAAVRPDRRQRFSAGGSATVAAADGLAVLLAVAAALLVALGVTGRADTSRTARLLLTGWFVPVRRPMQQAATVVARGLSRGIPALEPSTAGIFRIIFGIALVVFFATRPIDSARLNNMFDAQIDGQLHALVLQWLQGHPSVMDLLTPWLLTMAVAVTAGIYTRLTYALLVAAAVVWAFGAVAVDNTHPHSTLILTMIALLPSHWGDAISVDAWLRRRTGRNRIHPASKRYGYSAWVPGLVFGVAFAAAAWAKLAPNGIAWVLNGSVKYHFITDSANASVDWGLRLAAHPLLAILASLMAVAVEAAVITAAFTQSQWYRLAMGLGGLTLMVGFQLFMGVFWPGWWILLLGFLPWQQLERLPMRGTSGDARSGLLAAVSITPAQVALIVFIISQQVITSLLAVERAPMFSNYPMYSTTYASPAAFNASRGLSYRIIVVTDGDRVALSCNPTGEIVDEFRAALQGSAVAAAGVWRAVLACRPDLAGARQVTFEQTRPVFDWNTLKFTSEMPTIIGTLERTGNNRGE